MTLPDWFVDYYLKLLGSVPKWMLPTIPNTAPAPYKRKIYILAGQSNATGASPVADLTPEQMFLPLGWRIYVDGTMVAPDKMKRWIPVAPGLGANAQMFGPEVGFAKSVDEPASIIKFTAPGTALYDYWLSPSAGGAKKGYLGLLRTIRDAFPPDAYVAGILWMQGEADACTQKASDTYGPNMMDFIHDLREALGRQEIPFVFGKIHTSTVWPFGVQVRAWQDWIGMYASPKVNIFDTEDLVLQADNPHFTGQSEYTLGERFTKVINGPER